MSHTNQALPPLLASISLIVVIHLLRFKIFLIRDLVISNLSCSQVFYIMRGVPFTDDQIREQCQSHLAKGKPGVYEDNADFVVLQPQRAGNSFAVKIAYSFDKDTLYYGFAFMEIINGSTVPAPRYYKVPKGYGFVEDGQYRYLVMEYIEGPTMWEIMNDGASTLSEKDANDVAATLCDLRNDQGLRQKLLESRHLTPIGHWHPQSYLFPFDGDGGRVLDDLDDFEDFMTVRFKVAEVDPQIVPLKKYVITHGDTNPRNYVRCADGTIGILDLRTTFLAPFWWEYYSLHRSYDAVGWVGPLKKAMRHHGMGASKEILKELDSKFIPWFALQGPAYGR